MVPKTAQNDPSLPKTAKATKECPRLPETTHDCSKLPKYSQDCQKCLNLAKYAKNCPTEPYSDPDGPKVFKDFPNVLKTAQWCQKLTTIDSVKLW